MYSVLSIPSEDNDAGTSCIDRKSQLDVFNATCTLSHLTAWATNPRRAASRHSVPVEVLQRAQMKEVRIEACLSDAHAIYSGDLVHSFYDLPAEHAFFHVFHYLNPATFAFLQETSERSDSAFAESRYVECLLAQSHELIIPEGSDVEPPPAQIYLLSTSRVFQREGTGRWADLPACIKAHGDHGGGFLVLRTEVGALTLKHRQQIVETCRSLFPITSDVFGHTSHLDL